LRVVLIVAAILLGAVGLAWGEDDDWRGRGWCRIDYDPDKPVPPRMNLPNWVCDVAVRKRLDEKYTVYEGMNPFFVSGDFDGDGKTDAAVWVMNKRTKQLGVVVLHRGTDAVYVLGAGTSGERGADFRGLDAWTIYPKAPIEQSRHEARPAPNLRGDALWFGKSESASFFVYWDGRRYRYYQESD